MMAQFVRDLVKAPELAGADFAFLWASIGGSREGDLAAQSREKFDEYYGGVSEVLVTGLEDLSRNKVLEQHEILFFNWSKIKTRNKSGRRLRRENEQEITWDGMLKRTQSRERPIILIIDEAHAESRTLLAEEEIKLIQPKIVIHVTATHRDQTDIDVRVPHAQVVESGLIKEQIDSQTREEFEGKRVKDLDTHVLRLALKKRNELAESYREIGADVNPLLLIQLPNDDQVSQEEEAKKDLVLGWLRREGVEYNRVAVWLDKEKSNLENITMHNSDIDVLLFKQAPATGWDCPRAQVLLMYRETKDPVFQVQVLGRILRMPEGKHYRRSTLNRSYLYTTYTKNEIIESYDNFQGANQAALFHAAVRPEVKQMQLQSFVSQRTRYNDLGKTFQREFIKTANKRFRSENLAGLFGASEEVQIDLIVDESIADYDGFIEAMKEADSFGQKMSQNDVEKLYKKLCVEILRKQEDDAKFGNIARSYGKLKSAINVWFEKYVGMKDKKKYYPCVVNDLNRGANSVLLPVINEALKTYKVVREREEEEKDKRRRETKEVSIPPDGFSYTNAYEEMKDSKKCALDPCYVRKDNKNERNFIDFLEGNESVIHWYKNGDSGSEYFSVMREDGRLFFPDWFVWTNKGIWIIDTKDGRTAEGEEAEIRARALEQWLKKHKEFQGGLVKREGGVWKIAKDSNLEKWVNLDLS